MERKQPRARRPFTAEFKAEIVERASLEILKPATAFFAKQTW